MLAETQICGLDAKKYGFIMDHSIDDEARQSKCAEYAFAMGCYKFVETKYAENVNGGSVRQVEVVRLHLK